MFEFFPGIRLSHGDAQEQARFLPHGMFLLVFGNVGGTRVRVEVLDVGLQVFVVCVGFEAEVMFKRDSEANDEVHACEFCKEVLLPEISFSLFGVYPDKAGQVVGCEHQLGPVFSAFAISFVGCRAAEAQSEGDDKTEDGKEDGVYADCTVSIAPD